MPLDGHSYLVSQGWGGKGHALREGAISRPIVIAQKKNLAGVGKDRDEAFPFWDHLFSAAASSIKLKICDSDDEGSASEAEGSKVTLNRTRTGIISNRRPPTGAPADSGCTTPDEDEPSQGRYSLLTKAKREAAKRGLYSRFFRGPVLGPDSATTVPTDQNAAVKKAAQEVEADTDKANDFVEAMKVLAKESHTGIAAMVAKEQLEENKQGDKKETKKRKRDTKKGEEKKEKKSKSKSKSKAKAKDANSADGKSETKQERRERRAKRKAEKEEKARKKKEKAEKREKLTNAAGVSVESLQTGESKEEKKRIKGDKKGKRSSGEEVDPLPLSTSTTTPQDPLLAGATPAGETKKKRKAKDEGEPPKRKKRRDDAKASTS